MKPLTIILLCVPLPAQSLFQSLAATLQPAGSAFTETWNSRNPAGLCWNGGPSQCRNLWTVGGIAGQSMVTSPNSPTAAQAGASAIKMTNLAGTAGYLSAYGTFPTVTVGTSHDEYVWMNLASTTVAAYATKTVYCLSQSPACVGIVARIEVNPATTGVLALVAAGSTVSSRSSTITANAWHLLHIRIPSATSTTWGPCVFYVDGTTIGAFTCNSDPISYRSIGDYSGTAGASTFTIGAIYANNSLGGGFPFSTLTDFETGSGALTASNLGTSTHAGNGSWAVSNNSTGGLTFSSSCSLGTPAPVTVAGTQYLTNSSGAQGMFWDATQGASNANPEAIYTFSTPYLSTGVQFQWATSVTAPSDGAGYSVISFGNASLDAVAMHWQPLNTLCISGSPPTPYSFCTGLKAGTSTQGNVYMWTGLGTTWGSGGTAVIGPLNTNTPYCVRIQYNANTSGASPGNYHSLTVLNSDCATAPVGVSNNTVSFEAANSAACTASATPFLCCTGSGTGCAGYYPANTIALGRPGGETGYSGSGTGSCTDNLILDYVQGRIQ